MSNFVCSGAKIYCSYGSCTSSLVVLPDRTVDLSVGPMANKVDHTPQKNIFSFGICSYLSAKANHPVKCSPATNSDWCICKEDVLVRNQPALTTDCRILITAHWGRISLQSALKIDKKSSGRM